MKNNCHPSEHNPKYYNLLVKYFIAHNQTLHLFIIYLHHCSCGGEVSAQVKVHLTLGDSAQHELSVEDPELGSENISDQVDVLLAGDHDVVDPASTVQLLHLVRGLPSPVLNTATKSFQAYAKLEKCNNFAGNKT